MSMRPRKWTQSQHFYPIYGSWSREGTIGIPTGYMLDDRGIRVWLLAGQELFLICRLARHAGAYTSGTGACTLRGRRRIAHHSVVPRSRKMELYLYFPIRLHCVLRDEWCWVTPKTLPQLSNYHFGRNTAFRRGLRWFYSFPPGKPRYWACILGCTPPPPPYRY
jgi:hypothetical protein